MIALIAAITILSLSLVGTIHLLRYLTRQKIALPPVKFMLASGSALLLLVTVGILSRIDLANAQGGVDVGILKTRDAYSKTIGESIVFTLTVSNTGGLSTGSTVTVTDVLPTGTVYLDSSPSLGSYDNTTGIWSVGPLNAAQQETLVITAEVEFAGLYINETTVSVAGDSDPTNNTSQVSYATTNNNYCYLISDANGPGDGFGDDDAFGFNPNTGVMKYLGDSQGGGNNPGSTENIAFDPVRGILYVTGAGDSSPPNTFGTIDLDTGLYTPITDSLPLDFDGLSYNPFDQLLYASVAIDEPNASPGDIYVINPTTGVITFVVGTGLDIDDIAIDPTNGDVYGTVSTNPDDIVKIDLTSGASTLVGSTMVNDLEGLDFNLDGVLMGTTGNAGSATKPNTFFLIDKSTGMTTTEISLSQGSDFEGSTCMVVATELRITKTDGVQFVLPGQRITYTLTITNATNHAASGVVVTDTIPTSTTFVSASNGGAETSSGSGVVTWTIGALSVGQSTTRTVTVDISDPAQIDIINTARVSDTGTFGPDPEPGNNIATDRDTTLSIKKSVDPAGSVTAGDTLTYTLVVSNSSDTDATNAVISDTLPSEVNLVSVAVEPPGNGVTSTVPPILLSGAIITAGEQITLTIVVTVDNAVTDGTVITNVAAVSSTEIATFTNSNPVTNPVQLPGATISGQVRDDTDGDGDRTDADSGIGGVTVVLFSDPDGDGDPSDGIPVLTTTTTITGGYNFTNVPPGDYVIVETDLPGYTSTNDVDGTTNNNTNQIAVTATSGDNITDQDFLDTRPAAIGNYIWLDEDGDGVQDAGESGIGNVLVELRDATNTLVATTTTDLNGGYLFSNLTPGVYTVTVNTGSLPAELAANPTFDEDGTLDNQTAVTVTAGEEHLTTDFGYNWVPPANTNNPGPTDSGVIGDRVWVDADGDGRQDPGEPGLGGITVTLFTDPDGDGVYDTISRTTTTAVDGSYIFTGLNPSSYVVEVTSPTGYTQTGDPDATLDNRTSFPVIIGPGDVYLNADFGYQPTGVTTSDIGDTIWLDANANGSKDAGEPGMAGVSVALLDSSGTIIATDITDANGEYLFTGLPAGDYTVRVTDSDSVLGGLALVSEPTGGNGDGSSNLTLGSTDNLDQDFGYAPAGQSPGDGFIGDFIFLDANSDNSFDAGEPGLEGITVTLTLESGVVFTTTTNENGYYWFGNLVSGTYTVTVVAPTGLTNSVDPDGGTPNQSVVTLNPGNLTDLDQDFGYQANTPNTISGTIWEDTNADGTLAITETGRFSNVTVSLFDSNGNLISTATTDNNGDYSFTGLPDGTYTVDVLDAGNVLNGYWHSDGANDGADNNSQNDPYTVTVSGGQTDTTADFGYYIESGGLGNFVWNDLDGDGIQDGGEPGIPGITVTLTISYPNGAQVVLNTVTDASGFYTFTNLVLDEDYLSSSSSGPDFTLTVSPPSGFIASPTGQGTDATIDSDDPTGTSATVIRGDINAIYDFGFLTQADLGVSKFDVPKVIRTGETLTYTIRFENNGPGAVQAITLTETLPPEVDPTSFNTVGSRLEIPPSTTLTGQAAISNAVRSGSTVTWTGTYATGQIVSGTIGYITFTVQVDSIVPVDAILTNTVAITSDITDPISNNNIFTETTPVAQIIIEKATNGQDADTPPGPSIPFGDPITWTYRVTNTGSITLTNVQVRDIDGSDSLVIITPTVSITLTPGEAITLTHVSTASATSQYTNTATVTGTATSIGTDAFGNPVNSTTSVTDSDISHYVPPLIDLELDKVVNNNAPSVGDNVRFTVTVINNGPSDATGVVISDVLPSGFNFVGYTASTGTYSNSTGLWQTLAISNGEVVTLTITATVRTSEVYTNLAEVESANETDSDSTPGNGVDTDGDGNVDNDPDDEDDGDGAGVTPRAVDLRIVKTSTPKPYVADDLITYTLTVDNLGPTTIDVITITDDMGSVPLTGPITYTVSQGTFTATTGLWTGVNLGTGDVVTLTIVSRVLTGTTGVISNTAVVTTSEAPDLDPNNNDDTDQNPTQFADLELAKAVNDPTPNFGDTITFSIVLTNTGPNPATGVQVEDILPNGLLFAGASTSDGSTYNNNSGIWDVGGLNVGETITLTFVATVNTTSQLTNTAEVTDLNEEDPDSTPGNNEPTEDDQDSASITPQVTPGVVIDPNNSSTTLPGTTVTYTHIVTNTGNATDTFTITATSDQGYTVTTSIPSVTLAPNATATVVVSITIPTGVLPNIVDTTTITATSGISPTLSDTATDTTTVNPVVDLSLTKQVSNATPDVGSTIVFTLTVSNAGPSDATGVEVTDLLPTGYTYISDNSGGAYSSTTGIWSVGNLTANTTATLLISVTVNATGPYTNYAQISDVNEPDNDSTPDDDSTTEDDDDTVTPNPNPVVDLSLTKQVSNATPDVGSTIVFTLTVANAGPSNATGVEVTDLLPTGYTYISDNSGGAYSSTTGIWSVGNLTANTTATLLISVTVNATGPYTNYAQISDVNEPDNDSTPDDDSTTEDDDDTTPVTPTAPNPGVAVAKSVDISNVAPNQGVTYTLTVTNTGDVTLNPVAVTDTLPTMFTFGGATPAPDSTTNNMLVWNDVTGGAGLAPNAQVQLVITAAAPLTVGTYVNVVVVEATYPSGVVTDTDSVPIQVTDPVVDLVKNVVPPGAVDGVITFTILISNTGPSTLDQVPLIDVYTGPIEYIGGSPVADDSSVAGTLVWNDLTVSFGQNLDPGQTFTVTTVFSLTTQSTEFSMMNVATVTNAIDVFNNPVIDVSDPEEIINQPTAINLLYFEANRQGDLVIINWKTAVEIDNFGFRILRSATGSVVDATEITFIPSYGSGTMSGASYSYVDQTAAPNERYTYWLVDVDVNGVETQHGPVVVEALSIGANQETTIYMPVIVKE